MELKNSVGCEAGWVRRVERGEVEPPRFSAPPVLRSLLVLTAPIKAALFSALPPSHPYVLRACGAPGVFQYLVPEPSPVTCLFCLYIYSPYDNLGAINRGSGSGNI